MANADVGSNPDGCMFFCFVFFFVVVFYPIFLFTLVFNFFSVVVVVLVFYSPSTLFRSFRGRSVNLSTLFLVYRSRLLKMTV